MKEVVKIMLLNFILKSTRSLLLYYESKNYKKKTEYSQTVLMVVVMMMMTGPKVLAHVDLVKTSPSPSAKSLLRL